MRWFVRRLVFYVFAIWVALTINFLLPRLMPGSPLAGLLAAPEPGAARGEPGIDPDVPGTARGTATTRSGSDYVVYLGRVVHFDFGISTSNYPTPVSEVVGRTLPYSIFLVGVAFMLSFVLGTAIGMVAAWRRGGVVDNVVVPAFMALGAFPAFFTALLGLYFFGLKLHWFPIQHAYDTGLTPGFNWTFLSSAFRHAQLPILVIVLAAFTGGWVLNMRTVMINTISEDYVAMAHAKGLPRPPRDDAVRGPERDPAAAERLRATLRERRRRARLRRVRLQLPGRRPDAPAGRARSRLPARAGDPRRPVDLR